MIWQAAEMIKSTQRDFSKAISTSNNLFLRTNTQQQDKPTNISFILLEHFSMAAFTNAVDTLVTANLVHSNHKFDYVTLGLASTIVKSDIGINISSDDTITSKPITQDNAPHILIICGGFRCSLEHNPILSSYLKRANQFGLILGGLWNGAIALAQAGLLNNQTCALHPDNHAFLKENMPLVTASNQTFVISEKRVSCAGPHSALEMMLKLIETLKGKDVVLTIRDILSCDQLEESKEPTKLKASEKPTYPTTLSTILELMRNNIEEPLSLEELSLCAKLSRRQIERLFQTHLGVTPSRYYLELRITNARRLLLQSNKSITNIALALKSHLALKSYRFAPSYHVVK
jgi:AraC family transcriptional regulator, glycine betaine-responsive activator